MNNSLFGLSGLFDENFLTKVLAFVLNQDKTFANAFSRHFLKQDSPVASVDCEESMDTERPDLVFYFSDGSRCAIENKIDAQFQPDQIKRYLKHFDQVFVLYRTLTNPDEAGLATGAYSWYEVSEFLMEYLDNSSEKYEQKNKYVLEQFLELLQENRMSAERISWEIINGSRAIGNLYRMIENTLEDLKREKIIEKYERSSGTQTYYYWTIKVNADKKVFLPFFLDPPACYLLTKEKPETAQPVAELSEVVIDAYWPKHWILSGFRLEENHFLSSSIIQQMKFIKTMVQEGIEKSNLKARDAA